MSADDDAAQDSRVRANGSAAADDCGFELPVFFCLGRTVFGVLLVVAYGAGMAAMLTAAGLVLVRVRDRWTSRPRRTLARLAPLAPTGTAALVLCVGLGLAGRAAIGVIH